MPNAQKANEISDKVLPYEARAEFCQIFVRFLGNAFEIYWPLVVAPKEKKINEVSP